MNVGLLLIATGRYWQFVAPLIDSASRNFLVGHDVTAYVFTEPPPKGHITIARSRHIAVEPVAQDCLGWPFSTLLRYNIFTRTAHMLASHDYLYYCDVDMRFNGAVSDEIFSDVVSVQHPGFTNKHPRDFTFERRPQSSAYIPEGQGTCYYAGGLQGGRSERYLAIARHLASCVTVDLEAGLVAEHNDESHWNRYLWQHPPTLTLSPAYCWPEEFTRKMPNAKLIALLKNHAAMRAQ